MLGGWEKGWSLDWRGKGNVFSSWHFNGTVGMEDVEEGCSLVGHSLSNWYPVSGCNSGGVVHQSPVVTRTDRNNGLEAGVINFWAAGLVN